MWCRPWQFYDGHHRHHGVLYQAVTAPDGLVLAMHGAVMGSQNDAFMVSG